MLQSFNGRLKGPFTWIVVISISFIFVLSGMSMLFTNMGGSKSYVAKVGDNEISSQQFQQYAQQEQATTADAKKQVLDKVVNQYLIMADFQRHNIVVSKLALQKAIFTNPMFLGEDGKFSSEKLKQVAGYLGGMSKLEHMLSQNIQSTMIPEAITGTSFISDYENKALENIYSVNKQIEYTKVSPADLAEQVKPTTNDLQQYYDAHKTEYVDPAKKSISYYVISKDDFVKKDSISDDEIKQYYNTHRDLFKNFDSKTKDSIKKIIQNRQALEQFDSFTQGFDSIKFSKIQKKLGKAKTSSIINNADKSLEDIKNSLFFVNADKYATIPVSDNKVLVYQVDSSHKASQQSLDDVKEKVKKAYVEEKSQQLAQEKAHKLVIDLNSDKKVDTKFSKATITSDAKDFPKTFNDFVMFNSNDDYHSYQNKDSDIYVYKVIKVEPKDAKSRKVPSQVLNAYKQEEMNFYIQTVKKDIPVEVNSKNM